MLQGNGREIKRMLENRKDKLRAKLNKVPNNPNLVDAHERMEHNIYSYIMEINDVLSWLDSTEDEVYLADKRSLEKEKGKARFSEPVSGEFVEVWEISIYNEESGIGREYYVMYCTPLSTL